jgi:hypothetical protein
LDLGL